MTLTEIYIYNIIVPNRFGGGNVRLGVMVLMLAMLVLMVPASAETLKVKIHNPNDYDLVDYQIRIDLSGYLDSVSYLKITDENGQFEVLL